MHASIRLQVEAALGERITDTRELHGGCINQAFACKLAEGGEVFVKCNADAAEDMFAIEARGLAWLAEAGALRIPRVLHAASEYLVLEYIDCGTQAADYDELLGRGLARLHRFGAHDFGFDENGYLGTLAQDNRATDTWPQFYAERRLRPLLRRAIDARLVPVSWNRKFEELFAKLPGLVGDPEKPARLHGDLWSGNLHCDAHGQPVLIDPAVYGGHREVDLAMLQLFGSRGERFYGAYREEWPLQPGYEQRVPLHQLYPLLAHINLFGSSYNAQCLAALESYL